MAFGPSAGVLAAGPVEITLLPWRARCRIGTHPVRAVLKQPGQKAVARALRSLFRAPRAALAVPAQPADVERSGTYVRGESSPPPRAQVKRDGHAVLALLAKPLVVEPFDGVVERPRPVAAAGRGVQRVEDGLGPVSAQGDRVGSVLDQPELDRVGNGPSSYGSFGARLVRGLHPQVLRHERRRLLSERVRLAGDLEHDIHSAEPIPPGTERLLGRAGAAPQPSQPVSAIRPSLLSPLQAAPAMGVAICSRRVGSHLARTPQGCHGAYLPVDPFWVSRQWGPMPSRRSVGLLSLVEASTTPPVAVTAQPADVERSGYMHPW